jgi:DNA-binding CsgD family transcriptional regulator
MKGMIGNMELNENDWVSINNIINKINQVYDIKQMRKLFLDIAKGLIDYDLGIFDLSKVRDGKFISLYDPVVDSLFDKEFEERFISTYDNKYYRMSYRSWIYYEKKAFVFKETDIVNDNIRKKSQFYTEFLEPEGLIYSCGCNIVFEGINLGALNLYRTSEKKDFDERDIYILEQLQPHLINKLSQSKETVYEEDIRKRLITKYNLTDREMEIIDLVYTGLRNDDIGEKLYISINTVKKHMNNIFNKIGVKSRSKLNNFLNENEFRKG